MRSGGQELLDDALVAKFVELVTDGMTITATCDALDLHDSTWRKWRKRGETDIDAGNPDTTYARLVTGVQEARREAKHRALVAIRSAGFGVKLTERTTTTVTRPNGDVVVTEVVKEKVDRHWTALAWWLERSYPKEFARVDRQWVSGPDDAPVRTEVHSRSELEALAAAEIDRVRGRSSSMN